MKELFKTRVTRNDRIGDEGYLLSFPRNFAFTAGQVIGLSMKQADTPRLYSIASGEKDEEITILYTVKPDGQLTPPLSTLKKGDLLWFTHPFGNFICKENRAVWIATGTGIAPFASMIATGQYHGKTLIQGNRTLNGIYFHDWFSELMGTSYIACTSREEQPGCFPGRVTDYLAQLTEVDVNIPYYLCGIAEMVVDVRDLLIEKGVPYNNIMAEIFF